MTRADLAAAPYAAAGGVLGLYEQFVRPNPGILGWGATLGVAGLYDAWAVKTGHQTMSQSFHEGLEYTPTRLLCLGALGGLAVHLLHKNN